MPQLADGQKVGPYVVLHALPFGKGGMARVYVAKIEKSARGITREQTVGLKVALTTADNIPQERADFFYEALSNEVEILKKLRHPSIVNIYPIPSGTKKDPYLARAMNAEGQPWFCAMEYLGGGSLHAVLQEKKKLPSEDALDIAYQIGLALDYAHSKDIAHLDVKPDNVLFRKEFGSGGEREAVLVDFGIATRTYKLGLDAGAISYLSPERVRILRGELAPDHVGDQRPVDVYSMGLLLYRMLTGMLPFRGKDDTHIATAILSLPPTKPRELNADISPEVEELILDALEKDPQRRPDIHEFNERLEEAKRELKDRKSTRLNSSHVP
jgi:serine/threonine protein kinase